MKASELRKILSFCKEAGVKRIKTADFFAEFSDSEDEAEPTIKPHQRHSTKPATPAGATMPPDSKMLFMSTPFFDDDAENEEQTAS